MSAIRKSTIRSIGGVHGTSNGQETSVLESHKEPLLNTNFFVKNKFLKQWLLPTLSQTLLHLHQNTFLHIDVEILLLLGLDHGLTLLHIAVASPT